MAKTNLFIPGFAKSGSSFLFSYLSSAQSVSTCRTKEPAYFAQNFDMGVTWYHEQFEPTDTTYFLDGTVEYSVHPKSPSRIYDYNPEARLIFVVRDPYARAWSHYWHRVKMGEESRSLELLRTDLSQVDPQDYLVKYGRFRQSIREFQTHFDASQILVISLDSIVGSPVEVRARLAKFLDIELPSEFTGVSKNASRQAQYKSIAKLGAFVRSLHMHKLPIPKSIYTPLRKLNRKIQDANLKPGNNPVMPSWWTERLGRFLEDEFQYYQELVRREKNSRESSGSIG